MKLSLDRTVLSLEPFESEELANFSLIIGKNGSGKSQLLRLIGQDHSIPGMPRIEISPALQRIQSEGLVKEVALTINKEVWRSKMDQKLTPLRNRGEFFSKLIQYLIESGHDFADLQHFSMEKDPEFTKIIFAIHAEQQAAFHRQQLNSESFPAIVSTIIGPYVKLKSELNFIREIANSRKKKFIELSNRDYYEHPVSEYFVDSKDLFTSQLEMIFYNYGKGRSHNQYNYYRKEQYEEQNDAISDLEYTAKFPPPWTVINEILFTNSIGFYFKPYDDHHSEDEYTLAIYKTGSDHRIHFANLSSGEKTIIGLITKLFTTSYYKNELNYPELILLDEPDAHLHPEMSKLMLDVVLTSFVKERGINVIMTTHSPSTIALCPNGNIFLLKNGPESSLMGISKDDALKLYTDFIPTLSIDYKNHRHVFVESPVDVFYYQALFDKFCQEKKPDYKLYFISLTAGKSNCDSVKELVKSMREYGSKTAYGIIDWDAKNVPENKIFVHGGDERYSVENFLFDPIYIMILLLDLNNAHDISQKMGLPRIYNQFSLGTETAEALNIWVKLFFELLNNSKSINSTDYVEQKYFNGKTLLIPSWYLRERGHCLYPMITKAFPALGAKFNSEKLLQDELTVIIAKCFPFVPLATMSLFETLGAEG